MTTLEIKAFLQSQRLAVQSSVSPLGFPQSAVVGVAVGEGLELVFDTLIFTRKAKNLKTNPRISLVLGGLLPGDERTAQYEGLADFPEGEDLKRSTQLYFSVWPDGLLRQALPGIVLIRVRPLWIRYSDFGRNPPLVVEFEKFDSP